MNSLRPISVVVCARNSANLMEECLRSIREDGPDEIIVVDGDSTDATKDIAKRYANTVLSDGGRGLGYARALGVEAARNELVAIVSPDNIVPQGCLKQLTEDLEKNNWVGCEARIRVLLDEHSTYWDRAWDVNLRIDMLPGERPVIGNPSIYRRSALVKYRYDPFFSANEDTDLCERWRNDGLKVGIGEAIAYEKQRLTFSEFKARWMWYGVGDARFVYKWRHTPKIAWRHFFHPLRTYIIGRSLYAISLGEIRSVPFFVLCGVFRYVGFFKTIPSLLFTDQKSIQVA